MDCMCQISSDVIGTRAAALGFGAMSGFGARASSQLSESRLQLARVQPLPASLPVGHATGQQPIVGRPVMMLDQMAEFVRDNVLHAVRRRLDEVRVQQYLTTASTTSPAALHDAQQDFGTLQRAEIRILQAPLNGMSGSRW